MWLIRPTLNLPERSGQWVVATEGRYQSTEYNASFGIPAGFKTDLASIPRLLRWLIPVDGKHALPAILHDWLYTEVKHGTVSRSMADLIFLEAMREAEVKIVKAVPMYYAVRLFGWLYA